MLRRFGLQHQLLHSCGIVGRRHLLMRLIPNAGSYGTSTGPRSSPYSSSTGPRANPYGSRPGSKSASPRPDKFKPERQVRPPKKSGKPPKKQPFWETDRGSSAKGRAPSRPPLEPIVGIEKPLQKWVLAPGSFEKVSEVDIEDTFSYDRGERPEKGQTVDLECHGLSSSGKGVCKTESGFVVFVPHAAPGERLQAQITKLKPGFAEAERTAVHQASPHIVEPQCRHYSQCGGCNSQHIDYAVQLQTKNQRVLETIKRVGQIPNIATLMKPPIPCPTQYRYRNKVTFTIASDPEWLVSRNKKALLQQPIVGLHKEEDSSDIEEIEECLLQDDTANKILNTVKGFLPGLQHEASVIYTKLVIRRGSHVKSVDKPAYMVILYSSMLLEPDRPSREAQAVFYKDLVATLVKRVPDVISIYDCRSTIGREKAYPILNRLFGSTWLDHVVNKIPFRVAPLSFFQINTEQAGKLVDAVFEGAALKKRDKLLDLFCGVGLLGISLALRMKAAKQDLSHLEGYEVYNQATDNARTNAGFLGLPKKKVTTFKSRDLSQPTLGARTNCDVAICDPARSGLPSPVLDLLLRSNARTLVYVSCDVATLARDLHKLCHVPDKRAFVLESVQLCDMFPQTSHTETIAVLRRDVTWVVGPRKNAYVKMKAVERERFLYDKSGLRE